MQNGCTGMFLIRARPGNTGMINTLIINTSIRGSYGSDFLKYLFWRAIVHRISQAIGQFAKDLPIRSCITFGGNGLAYSLYSSLGITKSTILFRKGYTWEHY